MPARTWRNHNIVHVQVTIFVTCLNFAGTGSRISLPAVSACWRVKPSRKIALNSNGEVNCRELARRPWCTHTTRTPVWMVFSKLVAYFTGTFKCGKWQYKWWFFEYFWKIKGMNLQNNGVWRMVHHKLMYERGSWMGLSAWTFFMPSGINNRSCTQSHSWTPNLWPVVNHAITNTEIT